MKRLLLAAPFALVTILAASRAHASPGFPAVLRDEWQLSYTPDCTLCHASESGGRGTVVTYFGQQMEALGVVAQSDATLVEALSLDKAQSIDSDGSGTTDYDDLVARRDPNSGPGPSGGGRIRPLHGCAMAQVSGDDGAALLLFTALLALVLAARRRSVRNPVSEAV